MGSKIAHTSLTLAWDKMVKEVDMPETKAHQTAFRDAMEIGHSSSMSWEDQVQEEEEQKWDGSVMESSPEPDVPPPALEEGNASDVSMVNDNLIQHDLDVMVEEEREEDMETDTPARSMAPVPPKESLRWESFEARNPDDQCSQTSEESMDQNPPHDLDLDDDELLRMVTNLSIPGGHSDDSITLGVHPGEDDLWPFVYEALAGQYRKMG